MNLATHVARRWMGNRVTMSGIQPTGIPHLGNYLGALKGWVDRQPASASDPGIKTLYMLADLHSLTTQPSPKAMREANLLSAATLLGCGLDPARSTIFMQSQISELPHLAWILSSFVTTAELQRMAQWKDKSRTSKQMPLHALMYYPVLMAADILLFKATHVPVGQDQTQHLELARNLAQRFNQFYGCKYFPVPEAEISEVSAMAKVHSLRDPMKKMSKSDMDAGSRIELTDTYADIKAKVAKAVTDSEAGITYDPETRLALSRLIELLAAVKGISPQHVARECLGMNKQAFKTRLAEELHALIDPIATRIRSLLAHDKNVLIDAVRQGNQEASGLAQNNLHEIRRIVGHSAFHL